MGRPATVPVEAKPVFFEVLGKNFAYEPEDMRLWLCDSDGKKDLTEERVLTGKPQFPLADVKPQMVVLVLTQACNLRCRYCFARPTTAQGADVMSVDTAVDAVGMIPPGRDFAVGFFGGEPLVAFQRVKGITQAVKEIAASRGVRVRFSITTNSTLLTEDVARFLADENFGVIASLDGPQELHDANRPTAKGEGSFALVMKGLENLAKFPDLARRTTLRGTFDGSGEARLLQRLVFLNETARDFGFNNVSVEPADLSEGCSSGGSNPVRPSEKLFNEYMDAAMWYAEERALGRSPKFHHLDVRMRRLASRSPAPSECGAGVGYAAVDALGKVYACHRCGDCEVGCAETGIDTALQAKWRDNRYYTRKTCATCWLRNVCGGGCRLNSINNCGDIRQPDPLGCWLTDTCTRAAAWVLASTMRISIGRL